MNVTCPACGADMDLDVLLAHEESRQALGQLAAITVPLARRTLQYIRLFKPATRAMGHGRTVTLLSEILPDLQRTAITHKGREWAAPHDVWSLAFERMLERRDNGKLVLPLKSHGYLYEVIQGIVDSGEAITERAAEDERRQRGAPASDGAPAALADVITQAAVTPMPLPSPPASPAKPSRYALQLQAEIDAARYRRESPPSTDGDAA